MSIDYIWIVIAAIAGTNIITVFILNSWGCSFYTICKAFRVTATTFTVSAKRVYLCTIKKPISSQCGFTWVIFWIALFKILIANQIETIRLGRPDVNFIPSVIKGFLTNIALLKLLYCIAKKICTSINSKYVNSPIGAKTPLPWIFAGPKFFGLTAICPPLLNTGNCGVGNRYSDQEAPADHALEFSVRTSHQFLSKILVMKGNDWNNEVLYSKFVTMENIAKICIIYFTVLHRISILIQGQTFWVKS